jgi:hypothetical protein
MELGGEVDNQDKLNLLRLQIRQAEEAAAKLPEMIDQIRADCSHDQVIGWVGSSGSNRYRVCMYCGLCEEGWTKPQHEPVLLWPAQRNTCHTGLA